MKKKIFITTLTLFTLLSSGCSMEKQSHKDATSKKDIQVETKTDSSNSKGNEKENIKNDSSGITNEAKTKSTSSVGSSKSTSSKTTKEESKTNSVNNANSSNKKTESGTPNKQTQNNTTSSSNSSSQTNKDLTDILENNKDQEPVCNASTLGYATEAEAYAAAIAEIKAYEVIYGDSAGSCGAQMNYDDCGHVYWTYWIKYE